MDKLLIQWDILQMKAAYVLAEEQLIRDSAGPEETINWTYTSSSMNPEEFEMGEGGIPKPYKPMSEKEKLHEQLTELEKQYNNAIQEEEYLKAGNLHDVLNVLYGKWRAL